MNLKLDDYRYMKFEITILINKECTLDILVLDEWLNHFNANDI